MAETVQQLLNDRRGDEMPAVKFGDSVWTWRQHLDDASRHASAIIAMLDAGRPPHVGALLGNTPGMLVAMAAAGLGGYVTCGINTTRRGPALARDIKQAQCQIVLTDSANGHLLEGLDLPNITVLNVDSADWLDRLGDASELVALREVAPADTFMLIFTSGTSGEPKAVRVAHMMIPFSGRSLVARFEMTPTDVCYLAMPLFHSNALLAGWSVAVTVGASMVPATFSASGLLSDLRRYGATYMNYVGKPLAYVLATSERPDDHVNPLRVAFGNEASDRDIEQFGRRFGCSVWDGFGSTEGSIIITREAGCPTGSVGRGFPGVAIYDEQTLAPCPTAKFDETGALINGDAAIGELVNTTGAGMFQGYYNDDAATSERLRHGMYWSGDLAYQDDDGWIYLAGRTSEWMRVDGENLAAAPIERIIMRLPQISQVAIYGIPDQVGDQVMTAIVLRAGADLAPGEMAEFLNKQGDLSPKAWPRYVAVLPELPSTATNKVLKRELIDRGPTAERGELWVRAERGREYATSKPGISEPSVG